MMKKICIVLGTRPELIKMAPVIRYCDKIKMPYFIIHTGQHYSYDMDAIFFKELELPAPKYNLSVGSGTHGQQTGTMMIEIEKILMEEKPEVVIVQGDTNSVLAGSLSASKLHIPLGHVEAGLRSFDRNMPEEINRIISDHISDFLFAPTKNAISHLRKEGISKSKILLTGNTIVDSVLQSIELASKKSDVLDKMKIKSKKFFLLTVHRAENTDDKSTLRDIINGIILISEHLNFPIIWPIHPRTKSRMSKLGILKEIDSNPNIRIMNPFGFLDFLQLEKNALLAITDSGGVQEESCIMGTPCITLRENTERPETVAVKANTIVGTNPSNILKGVLDALNNKYTWKNPFGDGNSAEIIIEHLLKSDRLK